MRIMPKLDRKQLPQIPKKQLRRFIEFVAGNGYGFRYARIPADQLKPIQKHLNTEKVKNMVEFPSEISHPLIIDRDNHIADGHHRWAADLVQDRHTPIFCVKFECNLDKLIELGHLFDGSEVRSIHEDIYKEKKDPISLEQAKQTAKKLGIDFSKVKYSLNSFHKGMNVELEHKDVTHGDLLKTGKIALAHLKEKPNYYELLKKCVEK